MDTLNELAGTARFYPAAKAVEADCRVRYVLGPGAPTDFETASLLLNLFPFSGLEVWNGHSWELIWNGAVEFEGVAP